MLQVKATYFVKSVSTGAALSPHLTQGSHNGHWEEHHISSPSQVWDIVNKQQQAHPDAITKPSFNSTPTIHQQGGEKQPRSCLHRYQGTLTGLKLSLSLDCRINFHCFCFLHTRHSGKTKPLQYSLSAELLWSHSIGFILIMILDEYTEMVLVNIKPALTNVIFKKHTQVFTRSTA